jgi:hypothetical protein
MLDGRIPPVVVYNRLLAMKKVEEPAADSTATDTAKVSVADSLETK